MADRTLVICKPDAVERGLVGERSCQRPRAGDVVRAVEQDERLVPHHLEPAG
jgi:nucleoside diphosphate kinase